MENISPIVPHHYDELTINKAGSVVDVYTYKTAGVTQGTVTITFSDASKSIITQIVRT